MSGCHYMTDAPDWRIISNGTVFRVQRQGWLVWRTQKSCQFGPGGRAIYTPYEFTSVEHAVAFIKATQREINARCTDWKPVHYLNSKDCK